MDAVRQENQRLQNELTRLHKPVDYEAVRDRVVKDWRVAKRAESRERIAKAIDTFIAELPSIQASTPVSTPDMERVMEWVNYAIEDLNMSRVENAKRSLSQALQVAKSEGETKPKPYTPPPDGTAAPLVDAVVQRRKENRISTDDFRSELRAIAQRCGFKIFKRLNAGQLRDDWYATRADNIGLEVESGYKEYDLIEWLKKQNLQE